MLKLFCVSVLKKLYFTFLIAILILCSMIKLSLCSDEESQLKCDACLIVSNRFSLSFQTTEKEENAVELNEEQFIEAAESTCDEEWKGYGIQTHNKINRLVGPNSPVEVAKGLEVDELWERRLQDFCDELLAASPDEKTIYQKWKTGANELEKYLCRGQKTLGACASEEYGAWPGDDYDDYEDMDFDYVHDEF